MYNFNGKIAGVTGVGNTKGLGFAIAKKLLTEGCRCFIVARDPVKLNAMLKELSVYGETDGFICDVADYAQVQKMAEEIAAKYGKIDFYVNNAGIAPALSIEEMSVDTWDQCMAINVRSVFISAKVIAPLIREGGSIVNAASFTSLIPTAAMSVYSASKAAVLTLTRVMAAELAAKKIRVNAYVPGLMDTEMNKEKIATIPDKLRSQIACHTFGQSEDIANAVAFLVSEEAKYINGTHINVSGGKFCTQNPDWAFNV